VTQQPATVLAARGSGGADADSRARTHLANERTFLAWLRTGLSLVAVGLAAARFLPLDLVPGVRFVTIFALLLVLAGTVSILFGAVRYVRAYQQIRRGTYDPAPWPILVVTIVVAFLGVLAVALVLLLR
jgi:putative membrane protein